MLHPDFPVIEGECQMTLHWSLMLPGQFNRRVEDGDLVIWRPGLTFWIAVWGNDQAQTAEERLARIRERIRPEAFSQQCVWEAALIRLAYRLVELDDRGMMQALYGWAIGATGQVQMAGYFDADAELAVARGVWLSLHERAAT